MKMLQGEKERKERQEEILKNWREERRTKIIVRCSMLTSLMVVSVFLKIPVGFLPPITLQTLFAAMSGLICGRYATTPMLIYLAMGLAGMPVFADGGGIGYVLTPTFGYILGFVLQAYITRRLSEDEESPLRLFRAAMIGLGADYAMGMLYFFFWSLLYLGYMPSAYTLFVTYGLFYLPIDTALMAIAAFVTRRLQTTWG